MTRLPATEALIVLAESVVADGFDAHRPAVTDLVAAARARGIRPVLADIVADATAPRAVRERALGRLIVALSTTTATIAAERPAVSATAA